jgi:hypothetical protein
MRLASMTVLVVPAAMTATCGSGTSSVVYVGSNTAGQDFFIRTRIILP